MFLGSLQALKRQALEREGAVKKSCEGALTKRTDELEKVKVDFKVPCPDPFASEEGTP